MHDVPGAPDGARQLPVKPLKKGPSLKARAIAFLSRREHSRLELERKLAQYADTPNDLEQLLNQLERENWLSNERFAQALVHRRAPLQGTTRIVQELKQHGLADTRIAALREQLRSTELERARVVWQKKFGQRAESAKDYARQFRFLASRGFSSDCLRRILGEFDDTRY
ncbi:MAG: recombination regulator RecX [Burkholderiaceae bacterium]